jgi:hypothetical protein
VSLPQPSVGYGGVRKVSAAHVANKSEFLATYLTIHSQN